ncbi:hypothetical protein O7608_20845 [Solwaraspora sp. WMMA2056]|uniref:hypothetical protein n=1 Tax=Solwaraspora sp. WMMA2056 TaxID=3015161 RepID=UPI00259B8F5F|nr:hypothetical protein [Solwaraspora sp. WMMA2056]WJK38934.1 hypothetical protein O7608_20845 [Solwaraspora sp. WMMA2056]
MEYVSRVPRPPLDRLIDDLYYLEGTPPYARLTLPPTPAALLIVNLGAPLRIRAGTDIEADLIFYKNASSRHAKLGIRNVRQQRSAPWARWSCTGR